MSKTIYQIEGTKLNDLLVRKRNYLKHQERLREIQGKKVSPIGLTRPTLRATIVSSNATAHLIDKNDEKKYQHTIAKSSTALSIFQVFPANLFKQHHNSFYNQKEQFRRINQQNPSIVYRIMTQVSPLDHKKQQQFFMETRRLKDRLERFPFIKSIDKKLKAAQGCSISSFGQRSKRYSTEHSKHIDEQ